MKTFPLVHEIKVANSFFFGIEYLVYLVSI
jgi:hypothetical protein